jgi:hypothetical protein
MGHPAARSPNEASDAVWPGRKSVNLRAEPRVALLIDNRTNEETGESPQLGWCALFVG